MGIWRPTFSPDGTMIAFTGFPQDQKDAGILYVMRVDGSDPRQLDTLPVSLGDAGGPDWAPDPAVHRIAYETLIAGGLVLRVLDLGTKVDHNAGAGFWPSWSPDGSRIATCCVTVSTTAGILAGNIAQVQRFTPFNDYCTNYQGQPGRTVCSRATWSPDGSRLMAVDIAGGALLVAQADGPGGNPIRIPIDIGLDHPAGPYAWQPIWH
jgi:Tol biopolymer transport system component